MNVIVTSDTVVEGVIKGEKGVQVLPDGAPVIETPKSPEGRLDIAEAIEDMER